MMPHVFYQTPHIKVISKMENESSLTNTGQVSGRTRIIKNLVVMSSSMMLVFTAYDGLSMLQSTMNRQTGTVSQAVVYAGFCLSSLVLPKYAIKKLGCKAVFLAAVALFVPYIAANFGPGWYSLMPTALVMGVGTSMIWAAQTSYFNESVVLYCFLGGSDRNNPVGDGQTREKSPNESRRRSVDFVTGSNANFASVEVISSCEVLSEGGNCIKVIAEINPNCARGDDGSEISPEKETAEEFSRKNTDLLTDEEFTDTDNLEINDAAENNFLVINSKLQNENVLSVTNPGFEYSGDEYKELDSKTLRNSGSSSNKHGSEIVNHKSIDIVCSTKMKFKGEIASDVKDLRSRHLNKNKIIVSVISNIHQTNGHQPSAFERLDGAHDIPNALPTNEIESRFKVPNVEHRGVTATDMHDRIDAQHECPNPRKSVGYINTLRKLATVESVTARFFGSNGLAFHSAQMWSNLVSYFILQQRSADSVEESSCVCGASFCSSAPGCQAEISEDAGGGSDDTRYILTAIYVVLAVLAFLLVLFLLDPLGTDREPVQFSLGTLTATLRHCTQRIQLCLVPISLYVGMIQGFYTADFTKSYIACALGESKVGLVTVYYGLSCALSSTLSGYLVKYTGRTPVFLLMQLVNITAMVFLLVWSPDPDRKSMFYVTAVLLGVVVGILWSQIPAFYGVLFKREAEAAFASYYLFNSLGWAVAFSYSDQLCAAAKVYVLLAVSSLGVGGYLAAESAHRARKDRIGLASA